MARRGRRRKVTPEMIGEMRRLRKEGLTYKEIAERFDVAPMTVYNYLREKERVGFFKGPNKKIVTIAVVMVAVSVAFAGYYLLTRRGVEFKTFRNESYSFKFDYPAGWYFREWAIQYDGEFVATENAIENTYPYHIDWKTIGGVIGLTVYDKTVLEDQFGMSLDNLTGYISSLENNGYFVLTGKPTEIVIDDHSGVRFSATETVENIPIRFQAELVVKDNYFYNFVMGSSEENYSTYEPIFEHVIDSFSFLD